MCSSDLMTQGDEFKAANLLITFVRKCVDCRVNMSTDLLKMIVFCVCCCVPGCDPFSNSTLSLAETVPDYFK